MLGGLGSSTLDLDLSIISDFQFPSTCPQQFLVEGAGPLSFQPRNEPLIGGISLTKVADGEYTPLGNI